MKKTLLLAGVLTLSSFAAQAGQVDVLPGLIDLSVRFVGEPFSNAGPVGVVNDGYFPSESVWNPDTAPDRWDSENNFSFGKGGATSQDTFYFDFSTKRVITLILPFSCTGTVRQGAVF